MFRKLGGFGKKIQQKITSEKPRNDLNLGLFTHKKYPTSKIHTFSHACLGKHNSRRPTTSLCAVTKHARRPSNARGGSVSCGGRANEPHRRRARLGL